jgi:hypothetical protein
MPRIFSKQEREAKSSSHSTTSIWRPFATIPQCNNYCDIATNSRHGGNFNFCNGRHARPEPPASNHPPTINLPDGSKVKSTHKCDITIPGLPTVLVGHVVPKLSIASLIGIRVLCNTECEVVFTKTSCDVIHDGKVILHGNKDPSTDLWTLPINTTNERVKTTQNDAKGTQGHHACHRTELCVCVLVFG